MVWGKQPLPWGEQQETRDEIVSTGVREYILPRFTRSLHQPWLRPLAVFLAWAREIGFFQLVDRTPNVAAIVVHLVVAVNKTERQRT